MYHDDLTLFSLRQERVLLQSRHAVPRRPPNLHLLVPSLRRHRGLEHFLLIQMLLRKTTNRRSRHYPANGAGEALSRPRTRRARKTRRRRRRRRRKTRRKTRSRRSLLPPPQVIAGKVAVVSHRLQLQAIHNRRCLVYCLNDRKKRVRPSSSSMHGIVGPDLVPACVVP